MNQVQIIFLVVGLLSVIVLAVAVQQALARMRRQREERIQQLAIRNRNLRSALQMVPNGLLSKPLTQFIFGSLKNNADDALSLKPSQPQTFVSDLQELPELQKQGVSNHPIDSVEKANSARHALKSLQQEVKQSYKDRRLDSKQSKDLMVEVDIKMLQAGGNFYRLLSERSMATGDYKNAYAACQKLLDTYQKSRHKDLLQTDIVKAKGLLKTIHNAWLGERHDKDKVDAEVLAARMQAWEKDQDSWKKSQIYDD